MGLGEGTKPQSSAGRHVTVCPTSVSPLSKSVYAYIFYECLTYVFNKKDHAIVEITDNQFLHTCLQKYPIFLTVNLVQE